MALVALAQIAFAHNLPERRGLVVSFDDGVSLMVVHEWSSPQSLSKIRALYDRNQNGKLDKNEQRAARGFFVKRALAGIEIVPAGKPEVRIKDAGKKGIRIALLYPAANRLDITIAADSISADVSVIGGGVYTIDGQPSNTTTTTLGAGQHFTATTRLEND